MDTNEYDTDEELQCRICAEYIADNNGKIHIFEEDARKNYLQTKIRKYLYVLVSTDDRLPKMVCFTCIKRLEGIHRFAMMAHRAQERLKIRFYTSSDDDTKKVYGDDDVKDNNHGLLRSILIGKNGQDIPNTISSSVSNLSILPINSINNEVSFNNTEEMEVKIDPMVFLQCDDQDRSSSSNESDNLDSDSGEKSDYEIKEISNCIKNTIRRKRQKNSSIKFIDNHDMSEDVRSTESYECNICSRSFRSQRILQNHLWLHLPLNEQFYIDNNTSLNNSGSFVCPICNKKISTKGNLKVHLETHRPKGKYGCDICGRIFKTQSNLFRHKEYHTGIQFPCSVCGRVYPTNSTLRAHSITHSDLRPHACPLCDKTFKRNQDLKFHINQHTGARPYQCPYCPKAFASSGNCFSHRKRMHPKEVHRDRQRAADLMR